jgi:hypothetical protein
VANPATTADIVARWRPLSVQETTNAGAFLGDAWVKLKRLLPTIEADITADVSGDLRAATVAVLVAAVLRVLKNPDGYKQESLDDWSGTRDGSAAAGALFFTDEELSSLIPGGNGRAFSVDLLAGWTYGEDDE